MIAFIHLGKTAGSTFKNVLRRSFGHHHCDAVAANPDRVFRDSDLNMARSLYFGLWSLCSHHFQDPVHTLSAPLQYVTFIRDPLQRTASHYQHMHRDIDSGRKASLPELREWLQADARNFQIRQITGGEDIDAAIRILNEKFMFVGITEQYEQSLQTFARLSPWPVTTRVERKNTAPDTTVKKQLLEDADLRGAIEEATQADMALYKYVCEEFFPAQQERARELSGDTPLQEPPDRYQASRMFTNLAYRPAVKIKRALKL